MNTSLYRALLLLASANNPSGTAVPSRPKPENGTKDRTILFPDETVEVPAWGISGLPAMILCGAPQSCLFVTDLALNNADGSPTQQDATDAPASEPSSPTDDKTAQDTLARFSLSIATPCPPGSALQARSVTWSLTVPVKSFRNTRNAQGGTDHTPVIAVRLLLKGVPCNVDLGLMEMDGLDQPLLLGQDALDDRFLIRPDRPKQDAGVTSGPATSTPAPMSTEIAEDPAPSSSAPADDAGSSTSNTSSPTTGQTSTSTSASPGAATSNNAMSHSSDVEPATGTTTSGADTTARPAKDIAASSNDSADISDATQTPLPSNPGSASNSPTLNPSVSGVSTTSTDSPPSDAGTSDTSPNTQATGDQNTVSGPEQ